MSDTDPKSKRLDFIREIITEDLAQGKHETSITRFPPEPNGYLHLGHAKSICLNFGLAEENAASGAKCHLRFDDTNPAKESEEYVASIKEDVAWLGFDWGEDLYFASDYFEFFYECAVHLIKEGLAYVDLSTLEELRGARGDVNTPGTPTPFREVSVEENLERFVAMREGKFQAGEAVLRAKIDLASSNMNLRDPVLYRVMHEHHHNTGDKWCLYPMYDFAHPLEDALEHITHSLCTLEFENHRPLYDWVIENCPVPSAPRQIEFARLNLTYTVLSKRKLLRLVEEGHVSGWDDPRMPTISGVRRRGYTKEAIQHFCHRIGLTKMNSRSDFALLEDSLRQNLNDVAPRRMAVLDPVKLVLVNYGEDQEEALEVVNNPAHQEEGSREVTLTRELWIERDDFMEDPPKKFFRLGPGRTVRLRGGYCITYVDHKNDESGKLTEVHCEIIPGTIGASPPEGIKCRTAIHWVSAKYAADAEIRLYDRLFVRQNPDKGKPDFIAELNPESLEVVEGAKVEPALATCEPGYICQFERIGYFCADNRDHVAGEKPVFNRSVGLRDSWNG